MFQRSEIGKKRSKCSRATAMLNRICVTPNNEHYSLISFEKVDKSYHYVYEWLDCPQNIKDITSCRVRSKTQLGVFEIVSWISELRRIALTETE